MLPGRIQKPIPDTGGDSDMDVDARSLSFSIWNPTQQLFLPGGQFC
jgi:hypothetical protein